MSKDGFLEEHYKNRLKKYYDGKTAKIHEHNGKVYVFFKRKRGNSPDAYDEKPTVYDSWEDAGFNGFNII